MLCASKRPRDHTQAACGVLVLRPLVGLADVDRVAHRRVVVIIVIIPLVRRALMLVLLLAGGGADIPLRRVGHPDVLVFAQRIREVQWCALRRGYW